MTYLAHTRTNAVSDCVIDYGACAVSDAQLLGLLLPAVGTRNATAVAAQALEIVGGMHGLTELNSEALLAVPGITRKRLAMILAARCRSESLRAIELVVGQVARESSW